jgi:hypothetical protein
LPFRRHLLFTDLLASISDVDRRQDNGVDFTPQDTITSWYRVWAIREDWPRRVMGLHRLVQRLVNGGTVRFGPFPQQERPHWLMVPIDQVNPGYAFLCPR